MNKTKITLLSIGGVALVATLALAYLIYGALSEKSENSEEIENLRSDADRLIRLKIYPGPAAVEATKENRKAYDEWYNLAHGLASAGDRKLEETTPASFKAFINEEAKRMSDLPGSENGRFVKPDFAFGFDEYINKGKLPAVADLKRLQREWNDISVFLGVLIDAGASSVFELQLAKAAVEEEENVPKRDKRKKKAKKDESADQPDITRFDIAFTAGAEAIVRILNDIAANPRFLVAESMSFGHSPDELAERLGAKTVQQKETGSRRRRRSERAAEQRRTEEDESAPTGVVTDPASAQDFKVRMKIAVYDFRTRAEDGTAEADKEVK